MNENKSAPRNRLFFAGSIALNLFLLAFLLGRLSAGPMEPPSLGGPPPFPPPMEQAGGMMMPPPMQDQGGRAGPEDRPMPPPFVSSMGLFKPEEMRASFASTHAAFEKIREARQAFARALKEGPMDKAAILRHFAQVDRMMGEIRAQTQEKVAEKIASLPEDERQKFADNLLKERR